MSIPAAVPCLHRRNAGRGMSARHNFGGLHPSTVAATPAGSPQPAETKAAPRFVTAGLGQHVQAPETARGVKVGSVAPIRMRGAARLQQGLRVDGAGERPSSPAANNWNLPAAGNGSRFFPEARA